MRANEQDKYQRWLAQINKVCGSFAARPMTGEFYGELDATWTGNLKLSTVTAGGVNLFRTRQEIKNSNDAWFYTVFQLEGEAGLEQDDRQIVLNAGDITLIDASRPCSIYWPEKSRQISLLLPRQILEQHFRFQEVSCAQKLSHSLPTVQLSYRLLQDSMNNPALSETESEAALEDRLGVWHVSAESVPDVCREGAGGGAVHQKSSSGSLCADAAQHPRRRKAGGHWLQLGIYRSQPLLHGF